MTVVESGLSTRVDLIGDDRAVLVHIGGEIDQAQVEHLDWAFAEGVGAATRAGAPLVVADLSGVGYFASVGMTALLHARERAERSGVELVVLAPPRHLVTTLLVMTGLNSIVPLVDSVDGALSRVATGEAT